MGKTANGLICNSGLYVIKAVIDSTKAGIDARKVFDQKRNGKWSTKSGASSKYFLSCNGRN